MVKSLVRLYKQKQQLLIRLAIAGMLLCALPAVGFLMTKGRYAGLVFVAIGVGLGVLAVLNHLELGIIGVVLAGFFVEFSISTGTASRIVISLVVAVGCIALWVARMLAVEKRLALKPAPTNLPILAFMAATVVAWVWGRAFRDVFVHEAGHPLVSVVATMVMVLLPGCFLLIANTVRDVRWLQALVWVLLAEGMVALVVDLGSHFGVWPMQIVNSFLSTNGLVHLNTHGLLSMWCMAFALALALFNRQLPWTVRGLLLAYVGAWVYWGFFRRVMWLSGWVPAFAAAAVVVFLRSKKLFVILMAVMILGAGRYYFRTQYQGESERSGETRLAAYRVNWRITGKHLLFGTGPAGYASYYMSYFPTEAMASHSNYIDIVAQTGIVGTVAIMWFFGVQGWSGLKLCGKLKNRGDFAESLSAAVLAGTAGCVLAMALGDWLLPFVYTQGIPGFDLAVFNWLFMGSLWALKYNIASDPPG